MKEIIQFKLNKLKLLIEQKKESDSGSKLLYSGPSFRANNPSKYNLFLDEVNAFEVLVENDYIPENDTFFEYCNNIWKYFNSQNITECKDMSECINNKIRISFISKNVSAHSPAIFSTKLLRATNQIIHQFVEYNVDEYGNKRRIILTMHN